MEHHEKEISTSVTSKGKPVAMYEGWSYRVHRATVDKCTWLCLNERTKKCKGRITTVNRIVIKKSEHTCQPNLSQQIVHVRIAESKKRVLEETSTPTSTICREVLVKMQEDGFNFAAEIPTMETFRSTLGKIRRRTSCLTKEPDSREDIVIPDDLRKFQDGTNFLQVDDGHEDRILIFGSEKGIELMQTSTRFFLDGTFKSCCKQFHQLYTIHVDLGDHEEETNVVPVIYSLLPNKKQETYIRLFTFLKERFPRIQPKYFKLDFEEAVMLSLQKVFPMARLSGCSFHFSQCLWRKVQQLGMVRDYSEKEDVRTHIRMCAALALVPLQDVDAGWLIVMQEAPENAKLVAFFDYFVDTWLSNCSRPREWWNVWAERHRTNNVVEGWNSSFNRGILKKPSVLQLVRLLRDDAVLQRTRMIHTELGGNGRKRRPADVRTDQRIRNIMLRYSTTRDLGICLKALSHTFSF